MTGQSVVVTGRTLAEIAAKVREEHGPRARIVSAARVTSGGLGIAGLFAKRYVEATVELPERGRRAARATPTMPEAQHEYEPSPAQRVGLAALLADADDADEGFDGIVSGVVEEAAPAAAAPPVPPAPAVSTRSDAFAELMDDLAFNGVVPAAPAPTAEASAPAAAAVAPPAGAPAATSSPVAPPPTAALRTRSSGRRAAAPSGSSDDGYAPALLDGPGDLIAVIGETAAVAATAQAIADGSTGSRPAVRVAGTAVNGRFVAVDDRRAALEARAAGVELDRATIVAIGWDPRSPRTLPDLVAALAADQIWIAVDAGRKHDDTARFVEAVSATVEADGLAVFGIRSTTTPDTVRTLGLPVGWADA